MAQSSWPSPANSRVVNDLQYERMVATQHSDGLVGDPSDLPLVYATGSGLQVLIRAGRYAQLRGHGWASGSPDLALTIASNSSGTTRTDLVVLGLDRSTWEVTAYVKAGTPGAGIPTLTLDAGDTGKFEIPLAEVSVPSGATVISSGQVKIRHWYVRSFGAASAGADTRPVTFPLGGLCAEGGDLLTWNGTRWVDLTLVPTPVQSSQGDVLAGATGPTGIAGDVAWHDFSSAVWLPVTFVVPPSGRVRITVSGWVENRFQSTSTIWVSYRAAGGGMVAGTDPDTMNKRGISTHSSRLVGSKTCLFTGLTPGASVTLTPAYFSSAVSGDGTVTTIKNGNLIMEPA